MRHLQWDVTLKGWTSPPPLRVKGVVPPPTPCKSFPLNLPCTSVYLYIIHENVSAVSCHYTCQCSPFLNFLVTFFAYNIALYVLPLTRWLVLSHWDLEEYPNMVFWTRNSTHTSVLNFHLFHCIWLARCCCLALWNFVILPSLFVFRSLGVCS